MRGDASYEHVEVDINKINLKLSFMFCFGGIALLCMVHGKRNDGAVCYMTHNASKAFMGMGGRE